LTAFSCASAAQDTSTLKFGWRAGMQCSVDLSLTSVDQRVGTQTSQIELDVAGAGDELAIRFTKFKMTGMSVNDTPEQRRQGEAMGRAVVEREFFVTMAGDFRRAEPAENVKARLKKVNANSDRGLLMLSLLATSDQQELEDDYREEWQSLAGNWIGLSIEPGRDQAVAVAGKRSLTVTVGESRACGNAPERQCVTVRAYSGPKPEAMSGFWTLTEIEVEPGSLIPHRWSEDQGYRAQNPDDENKTEDHSTLLRQRTFSCQVP
jgi:hypothetical protein